MKKEIIVLILVGVLFLLVIGSIIGSVTFYKEYKDKVEYLEQQSQSGKSRIEGIETKVDSVKATVDDITSQVKNYGENIKAIQNTVTLSDEERKSLLAKLEDMKKDLQGWQKDYSTTVIDMRQSMLALRDELDKMTNKTKEIELGKITVKQDDKKASSKDTKQSSSSAAKSGNFKSSNVKKVSSY